MARKPGLKVAPKLGATPTGVSARSAFQKIGFDVAKEWVKAYHEIEDPKARVSALEKIFDYVFPKVSSSPLDHIATMEMEPMADIPIEKLLEAMNAEHDPTR